MNRRLIVFVASGAYLGYAPVASGTFGTLAGVVVHPVFEGLRRGPVLLYVLSVVALVAAAIWIADLAEPIFAEKDSGKIVVDEVAGYIVTTLFLPLTPVTVIAGFLTFRVFDVLKPWPANVFDRREGGVGVVMDDVFAGVYANLALRGILWTAGVAPLT